MTPADVRRRLLHDRRAMGVGGRQAWRGRGEVDDASRRRFLGQGGALVVSFALPLHARAAETPAAGAATPGNDGATKLPGSLADEPMLDAWLRIDASNRVTVFTGKAELGQGIRTALLQLAAEELVVAPARIEFVTADTARTPDEGYTAGSQSMQHSGAAIQNAAAQAREILLGLAARRLAVAREALRVDDGVIHAADGRTLSYGALVSSETLHVRAQPQSRLVDVQARRLVGRDMPRVDIPAKVTGGAAYVQDLRLPGMLHARVVRPPSYTATLVDADTAAASRLAGVVKIVRDGSFLAVLAEREYQAVVAMRALDRTAVWQERPALPQGDLYEWLTRLPSEARIDREGDARAAALLRGGGAAAGTTGASIAAGALRAS
jgi:hypothetical protein